MPEPTPEPEPGHAASAKAVYDHSAELYVNAVGTEISSQFEAHLDRAVLTAFAELMIAKPNGRVLDIGCGPGRVAAYLSERGLAVSGVDISPRMVAAARLAHPGLTFDEGSLTDLPVASSSVVGAVYWYSIIATPPTGLAEVWRELDRVLGGDGLALIAFQSGENNQDVRPDAYGSSTTLTLYRHSVSDVVQSVGEAGFEVRAEVWRAAELPHETSPQAFLLVQRQGC